MYGLYGGPSRATFLWVVCIDLAARIVGTIIALSITES
ncbi:hypothetical protein DSOL_1452 [Desulfosporosinus metallidurans]|uniref:Uncharacterized protein n=1 Tax=Desulfosporosinus metallidurans TaxID=1888891 RepID=A0A1Q8QZH4_9FIRM|nr:hypothetical protein DSOL_1452 [Desulfosporosinus metallidurans]